MPTLDYTNLPLTSYERLRDTCRFLTIHYNLMLCWPSNDEVANLFFQEKFDQHKFYDV